MTRELSHDSYAPSPSIVLHPELGISVFSFCLGLPQVHAGARMFGTRLIALVPTVIMAVIFEASNTFDKASPLMRRLHYTVHAYALLTLSMADNRL